MASQPPTRASINDRRAASQRQQRSRPTSAAVPSPLDESRSGADSKSSFHNRKTSTTTETKRTTESRQTFIKRTVSSVKRDHAASRKSSEVERPVSKDKVRKQPDEAVTPWSPHASLIAPSSAPLASRISVPPEAKKAPATLQPPALSSLSLDAQEKAIIDDLLFVLMGFEGQYIRYVDQYNPLDEKLKLAGPQFRIQSGLDPSLRDLAHSMLKTATHFCAVEAFVEVQSREEMGTVNHALCAAMRKLLKDYMILIAQLEHQMLTNDGFTLHQFSLHTKPTAHMMLQLYGVAHEILKENSMLDNEDDMDDSDDFENILESLKEGKDAQLPGKKICKGGSVLRLLTRRLASMAGDPPARQLLTTLLRESSRPYMAMLNEWLHHGNVRDHHQEFLIKEQKSIRREGLEQDYTDEYWEKRYTLRQELVPPQLESLKDKVLLAGKYLNVVRECGGIENVTRDLDANTDLPHTFEDPRFAENVSGAYSFANQSLMKLLITTHGLPSRLRSLKHYFFLDRSDFFSYFLELTNLELRKPAKSVNIGKLQTLLETVLRQPGSVAAEDPYKEDVKVVMNDVGLTGWLMRVVNVQGMDADATSLSAYAPAAANEKEEKEISGYEALTFDYAVPFPLSLVVSRVTLTRYQLLFRYLLSLRHLETLLTNSWTEHTKAKPWNHKSKSDPATARKIENWKRRAWCLRSRMLCFVQQLLYFCTSEVIEPNWLAFMSRIAQAEADDKAGDLEAGANVKRTVDELMQDHIDMLATCLKECMLTNSKLLRINSKVMSTCTLFANYTASLSRYLAGADPDLAPPNTSTSSSKNAYDPAKLDKLFSILQQYEDHFSRHLKILLDALNYLAATETVVFLGLCSKLSMANEGGPGGGPGPGAYG
ncbi:Putative gamma-tubulin complex component protein [Septoria linicola]|uniref:Spindle pole body component n=1 Tax=Septoria linicola TaxID=215465 RepID=A0A9Q9ATQ8_9PEZI|nr:putative gamma-tubulin complex component protein [Septoria linicola]USW53018.1 Putative gamma-tubulin complex component protein [Septoria linicola]